MLTLRSWRYSVVSRSHAPESLTSVSSSGFIRLLPSYNTNNFGL
ncbi:Predicted Dehydrogenase and protein [Yersinia rohdei ATCC 43380]|nr:Predicted Dehydrogenase and protein [Yersinia rohdei ATCC 43380]